MDLFLHLSTYLKALPLPELSKVAMNRQKQLSLNINPLIYRAIQSLLMPNFTSL